MLHPSVLALVAGSLLSTGLLVYAGWWAAAIVRRWDLASGSALQLDLERRTALVSAIVRLVLLFQLSSLFLFVHTADGLAPLFTGAMCAAGVLLANGYGYPVLLLKVAGFLLAGVWLALDHLDAQAPDYPLIRIRYASLLAITPLFAAEALLQGAFFADLHPEVITSCCGSQFGSRGGGGAVSLAGLPPLATLVAGGGVLALAMAAGVAVRLTGRGALALGIAAALAIPTSVAALISVISPYVYELPTHHCPFCLLQAGYHHLGYALYGALLCGGIAGMAVAVVAPARSCPSLAALVPGFQARLAVVAATSFAVLAGLAGAAVATSRLQM